MSILLDIRLDSLAGAMNRYVTEFGMDGVEVIRTQTRLLIKQLIDLTPPKSLKQGRAAVARDVRRSIGLIDEREIRNRILRAAIQDGEVQIANFFLNRLKKGPLKGFHAQPFDESLHTNARGSRGRVHSVKKVLAIPGAEARRYLATVQKRVGMAKGAFVPAYVTVGGSAPNWIARHRGRFGGTEDVALSPGEAHPRITVVNTARGMESLDQSDVDRAILIREQSIERHLAVLHSLRARETNLD